MQIIQDPYFTVDLVSKTDSPQKTCYLAAHQDYSEKYVQDEFFGEITKGDDIFGYFPYIIDQEEKDWIDPFNLGLELDEKTAGERLIQHCVKYRHWGVLEHPQLVISAGYFPHEVMQQLRTHRITSFDVQSGRYTGQRICQLSRGEIPESEIEKIFYLRPLGFYTDRQGNKYEYTEKHKQEDLDFLWCMSHAYRNRIDQGFSEEHARQVYSDYALRQHFVMSANLRSWLHVISVRHKEDVQLETKTFAAMVWEIIKEWVPEVAAYFEEKHLNKNQLMP